MKQYPSGINSFSQCRLYQYSTASVLVSRTHQGNCSTNARLGQFFTESLATVWNDLLHLCTCDCSQSHTARFGARAPSVVPSLALGKVWVPHRIADECPKCMTIGSHGLLTVSVKCQAKTVWESLPLLITKPVFGYLQSPHLAAEHISVATV